MLASHQLQALREVAYAPTDGLAAWLSRAEDGVEFLKANASADYVVLYATLGAAMVQSILAPVEALTPAKANELITASVHADSGWCIQHELSVEGRRIYLDGPVRGPDLKSLAGGEKVVFRRNFHGYRDHRVVIELSQRLVQALDLHFISERSAYCRLDARGDLEDVIVVIDQESGGTQRFECVVLIQVKPLAEYMAVSGQALFRKFDFTRFPDGSCPNWSQPPAERVSAPDLFYARQIAPGRSSYVCGGQVIRTVLTVDDMIRAADDADDDTRREYETFKIFDRKNDALVEVSCGPDGVVDYYTQSDKPWTISPAFFRPEVLARFKADPDKYDLTDREIGCRSAWFLKTYDINAAGQVHTYIGYLANLPIEEQRYWKLFNEWPKAGISERAYQGDILGQWALEADPLQTIKQTIRDLDGRAPPWWKARGEALAERVLPPATTSAKEWADEILALDQLIVEGFLPKILRTYAVKLGATVEAEWGSLKLIEAILEASGATPDDAKAGVAALRSLHALRNKIKGHASGEAKSLEREALAGHGTLRAHFLALCTESNAALTKVVQILDRVALS